MPDEPFLLGSLAFTHVANESVAAFARWTLSRNDWPALGPSFVSRSFNASICSRMLLALLAQRSWPVPVRFVLACASSEGMMRNPASTFAASAEEIGKG